MGNPFFWKTSLLQPQTLKSIQMLQGQSVMEVISRAIGLIGYGLTSSSWTSNTEFLEIAYKELYPIILSALLWGGKWAIKWNWFSSVTMRLLCMLPAMVLLRGILYVIF